MSQHDHSDLGGILVSSFGTLWRRMFLFVLVGSLAHLVGKFFYIAPLWISEAMGNSVDYVPRLLHSDDLYMLPLKWIGTMVSIGIHPLGALGAIAFVWALLCFLWDEEYLMQGVLMLAIVQPADSFFAGHLHRAAPLFPPTMEQSLGAMMLAGYESLFVLYWWRQRQRAIEEREEA